MSKNYQNKDKEPDDLNIQLELEVKKRLEIEKTLYESQTIAHIGSYVTDFTTGLWTSTLELDRIFGIDENYIRSVGGWLNIVHSEWKIKMSNYLEYIIAEKKPFDLRYKITRINDKKEIWVHGLGEIRFDGDTPLTFVGTIQDISELVLKEESLKVSEEKFRYIFDNSPIGKSITLMSGEVYPNKTFCSMLGYSEEELKDKNWKEISHLDDIASSEEAINPLIYGLKEKVVFNKRYIKKDGSILWAEIYVSLRKDSEGKGIYYLTHIIDITEKIESQAILLESEMKFKTIFNKAPLGMMLIDSLNGHIYEVNQKFSDIIGRTLEKMCSIDWVEITHPDDIEEDLYKMSLLNSGKIAGYNMNKRYIKPDGSIVWVNMTVAPYIVEDNHKIHLCMVEDITKQQLKGEQLKEINDIFKKAVEEAPFPIMLHAEDGEVIQINHTWEEISGYSIEDIPKTSIWAKKAYGEKSQLVQVDIDALYSLEKRKEEGEYRIQTKSGEKRVWNFSSSSLGKLPDGRRLAMSMADDVTKIKELERVLFEEKEQLQITFDSIGDGVITVDVNKNIVMLNDIAQKLTGWTIKEAAGKKFSEVFNITNFEPGKRTIDSVEEVLKTDTICELANHTVLTSKNGIERHIADTAAPIKNAQGKTTGVVMVFRDITEKKQLQDEINYLSYHDYLTGLYNRAYFKKELDRIDKEEQLPISLLMGDVNGLKILNDVYGHEAGDDLLKRIANILKETCPENSIIARWGGDEFTIIFPKTSEKEVNKIYSEILNSCKESDINSIALSISLGLATKNDSVIDIQNTLKEAEDKMYTHKLVEGKSVRSTIIASLQKTLFEKSCETEEHAVRMLELSNILSSKVGLSQYEMDEMRLLTLLHDVGKIGVSENILNKAGNLTDDERREMKKHCEIGYRIAQSTPELAHISELILTHHERWDGTGYPQGLKGEQIPKLSRILSIIDAFDVMTHERPYKAAASIEDAIEEIKRCSGSQFDPYLVEEFLKMKEIKLSGK